MKAGECVWIINSFHSRTALLHIPPCIVPCICMSVLVYLWILCFCICLFVLIDYWDFVQTSKLLVFVVECILIVNSFHSAESFKLGYYPPRQSEDLALSTFECSRVDGAFVIVFCIFVFVYIWIKASTCKPKLLQTLGLVMKQYPNDIVHNLEVFWIGSNMP